MPFFSTIKKIFKRAGTGGNVSPINGGGASDSLVTLGENSSTGNIDGGSAFENSLRINTSGWIIEEDELIGGSAFTIFDKGIVDGGDSFLISSDTSLGVLVKRDELDGGDAFNDSLSQIISGGGASLLIEDILYFGGDAFGPQLEQSLFGGVAFLDTNTEELNFGNA